MLKVGEGDWARGRRGKMLLLYSWPLLTNSFNEKLERITFITTLSISKKEKKNRIAKHYFRSVLREKDTGLEISIPHFWERRKKLYNDMHHTSWRVQIPLPENIYLCLRQKSVIYSCPDSIKKNQNTEY